MARHALLLGSLLCTAWLPVASPLRICSHGRILRAGGLARRAPRRAETHPQLTMTDPGLGRRAALLRSLATVAVLPSSALAASAKRKASCGDIETCRELGDRAIEKDMAENPTIKLADGVRFKKIRPGVGSETVGESSTVDINYSISMASGAYMYSLGFGYEKDAEGRRDLGTESYRVRLGSKDVPLGIENAMLGMKRGERRRVELPPAVGFETSDWNPAPQTRRGKATVVGYRQILTGNGSTQPPFPAETIWDIEVVRIRSPTSALPPPGS